MAEENKIAAPENQNAETTVEVQPSTKNPFADESWSETIAGPKAEEKKEVPAATTTATVETKKEETETEVVDGDQYLKTNLGYDNWDAAKKEVEELRKYKETNKPQELKFENPESEKLFNAIKSGDRKEVHRILDQQEKLERLTTVEVTEDIAGDIIKMGMKIKNPDLSKDEIEWKFNKQYSIPREPVQNVDETDDEFAARKAQWQESVNDIKMSKLFDAKTFRPDLAKQKAELVLPEIKKEEAAVQTQPTQEELDAAKTFTDSFLSSLDPSVKGFNGFSVQVKNKDVDFTVNYGVSETEKTALAEQLKAFAENGFNTNKLFLSRWVDEKGVIKTAQMVEDLSLLEGKERIFQKIASDAASQRLEAYLKEKKQINVNETKSEKTFTPQDQKSETEKMADFFWDN